MVKYPEVYERLRDRRPAANDKRDPLLNVRQVQDQLNCSKSHVYNLIKDGALDAVSIGAGGQGGKRVKQSEVDRYLAEGPRDSTEF